MTKQEIDTALRKKNNAAHGYRFLWRVKKVARHFSEKSVPTAFLFEPDWSGLAWVEVLLNYLETYPAGAPVALVIPMDGGLPHAEVEARIMKVIVGTQRETFPDVVLLEPRESPMETLRGYESIQWISS